MKKNIKLFRVMLGCLAVMALSSCLSDNDNNSDPEKEWKEWYESVKAEIAASLGSYGGYVYHQPNATVAEQDSLVAEWDIVSDSVMMLRRVPTSLLVEKLPEKQLAIKEAVSAVGTVDILVKIGFNVYYKSPLLFYVYPEPVKLNVNVDGQTKAVVINFYNTETSNQSFGQCMVSNGQCLVKLFLKNITLDGVGVKSFDTIDYAYLYWLGKKQ